MSGLWDYPVVSYDDTGDWGSNSQEVAAAVEDGEGNGRPSKRARRKATRAAKPVVVVDSDDSACCSDSDDEGFRIGRLAKPKVDADPEAVLDSGCLDSAEQQPVGPSAIVQPVLCDAARMAIEQSRKLQQQLDVLEAEPEDVELPSMHMAHGRLQHLPFTKRSMAAAESGGTIGSSSPEKEDDLGVGSSYGTGPSTSIQPPLAAADDVNKITIICQCRQGSIEIRIRKSDPFSKLQKAFLHGAADKGWLASADVVPAGFKLQFDGDRLSLEDTPGDLDLDEGERIDVSWKQ